MPSSFAPGVWSPLRARIAPGWLAFRDRPGWSTAAAAFASGSPAKAVERRASRPAVATAWAGRQVQDGSRRERAGRSMEFSSSLTLPGQSCSIMVRNASSLKVNLAPCSRLMWSRKCAAKAECPRGGRATRAGAVHHVEPVEEVLAEGAFSTISAIKK